MCLTKVLWHNHIVKYCSTPTSSQNVYKSMDLLKSLQWKKAMCTHKMLLSEQGVLVSGFLKHVFKNGLQTLK